MNNTPTKKETKKKRWTLSEEVLKDLDKNPEYKPGSSETIKRKSTTVRDLIKSARILFEKGNFIESAKIFRQISKEVRDIQFSCEQKGNYDSRNILNDLTGKEWLRHTKSWTIIDGKPSDIPKEIKNHPASYPPSLARHFIELFTKENDWVFDPFMGIGSTLVASKELKRNCWGTELNSEYANYAQQRIQDSQTSLDSFFKEKKKSEFTYRVINADCRTSFDEWKRLKFPKVKFVMTSPPYWNMLGSSRGGVKSALKQRVEEGYDEVYSKNEDDLGNIDEYTRYLNELASVFTHINKIMVDGGYLVIVLQNIRDSNGDMKPVAWDFAAALKKTLTLRQEFIWLQDQKFMGIWGYPTVYISNVHHHYCLVFQKTD